jgi:rhamnulose-1-phosphate aldolase/alcohol dehydrogenase
VTLWDEAAGKDDVSQLVYLSNLIGADLSLVQPGGGNTSVKLEETDIFGAKVQTLVVKGSGTDLRTITAAGFTHLYLDRLATLRQRDSMTDDEMMSLMRACMLNERDPLPSVETPLHSLIPHKFVAHTHDVASLSLTDTPSACEHVERLFGKAVAFLEYVRPGFPLAKRMAEKYADGPPEGAIALAMEKHGLAAWGDTAKQCYENLTSVVGNAAEYVAEQRKGKHVFGPPLIPPLPDDECRALAAALAPAIRSQLPGTVLDFDDSRWTLEHIAGERFAELAARGVMTPEHILRAGVRPVVVDTGVRAQRAAPLHPAAAESVAAAIRHAHVGYVRYAKDNGQPEPIADWLKVIAVPGIGVFYAGKDRRNALIAGECYRATLEAMAGAEAVERFEFLSDADACEMEYWPLERRKIAEAVRKDLDGKIALIVGGASGIGRATALRFAKEGAHVAIADLDFDCAQTVAGEINAAAPECGLALAANAADPAALERACRETVLHFGGLDVLFYSPGVAPELHPVAEMPDTEIQAQLRVHFEGAVAATRAASQVMLAQGNGGRLIYNASKAAYAPGENAAAYGASKAALVHYVRNAANELSRYGITANYINADAIDTPLFRALVQERATASGQTEDAVLQRYADRSIFRTATVPPEAVAEAALWLASDRSAHTSGCVITVGGGAEGFPR